MSSRYSIATLALLIAISAAAETDAPAGSSLTITVRISNQAGVAEAELTKAKWISAYILNDAGLSVAWLDCPLPSDIPSGSPCRRSPVQTEIALVIVGSSGEKQVAPPANAFGSAIMAPAGGFASVAYVFYLRLLAMTGPRFDVDGAVLLGCVMAHEMGHLLLGTNAHSTAGIMRPMWSGKSLPRHGVGQFVFTEEQKRSLQQNTVTRAAIQQNDLSTHPDSASMRSQFNAVK